MTDSLSGIEMDSKPKWTKSKAKGRSGEGEETSVNVPSLMTRLRPGLWELLLAIVMMCLLISSIINTFFCGRCANALNLC